MKLICHLDKKLQITKRNYKLEIKWLPVGSLHYLSNIHTIFSKKQKSGKNETKLNDWPLKTFHSKSQIHYGLFNEISLPTNWMKIYCFFERENFSSEKHDVPTRGTANSSMIIEPETLRSLSHSHHVCKCV